MNTAKILLISHSKEKETTDALNNMGVQSITHFRPNEWDGNIGSFDLLIIETGSPAIHIKPEKQITTIVICSPEARREVFDFYGTWVDEILSRPLDPFEFKQRFLKLTSHHSPKDPLDHFAELSALTNNLILKVSDGKIEFANETSETKLGASEDQTLHGLELKSIIDPDYVPFIETLDEIAQFNERVPLKFKSLNGSFLDAEMAVRELRENGKASYLIDASDIGDQNRSANAILEREEHLRGILNNAPDAILTMDEKGQIESFNASAEKIFGINYQTALTKNLFDLITFDTSDRPEVLQECFDVEAQGTRENGEIIDVAMSIKSMIFGERQRYVSIIRDITEQKRDHQELAFLATHDPLTKLPNSHFIISTLERMIDLSKDDDYCSVMFINLERLNRVNDLFGHQIVDKVLEVVAERLNASIGQHNIIGRWGGGKFIAILAAQDQKALETYTCPMVINSISQPMIVEDNEIVVGCKIGISTFPQDCQTPSELVKNAGMAAFEARQDEKTHFKFFETSMQEEAEERDMMERELRLALQRNELSVYYQPKIDLNSGIIIGMEALIRWNHPTLGFIPPTKFIPIAEDTGLIISIGEWVLKTACHDTKAWNSLDQTNLKVAVNLSSRQFDDDHLLDKIEAILEETSLSPYCLELEITESSLMRDVEKGMQTLKHLRELGITIAIDDFGTGYSSLSYLRKIPLDTLKIDQSFVRNLHSDPDDAAIARTILDMADNLGLKVVAEGIEIDEHENFLKNYHCQIGQGYHYSRPVPSSEFNLLINKYTNIQNIENNRRKGRDRRRSDRRQVR